MRVRVSKCGWHPLNAGEFTYVHCFLHRYISLITTIKIFPCWYIKKVLKNVYAFFIKLLATAKQLIRRNSICCFKNQAIFQRLSKEIGLTPPLPLFVFIRSLRTPLPPPQQTQGFPQVLRTWWGSSKFDGEGLSQYMGGAWGEDENSFEKYLWWSSFDSKVAGYKPASLQIY